MPTLLGAGLLLTAAPALAEAPLPAEPIVESRVVLRLQDRRVYLYSGEMLISSYPVAVGTDETPTPQGEFLVGNRPLA